METRWGQWAFYMVEVNDDGCLLEWMLGWTPPCSFSDLPAYGIERLFGVAVDCRYMDGVCVLESSTPCQRLGRAARFFKPCSEYESHPQVVIYCHVFDNDLGSTYLLDPLACNAPFVNACRITHHLVRWSSDQWLATPTSLPLSKHTQVCQSYG